VRVLGNVFNRNKEAGMRISDNSVVEIRGNECIGNQLTGIIIRAQAEATLDGNRSNENMESGIAFFQNASGIVTNNECANNALKGIAVGKDNRVTLENNNCYGNGGEDIYQE